MNPVLHWVLVGVVQLAVAAGIFAAGWWSCRRRWRPMHTKAIAKAATEILGLQRQVRDAQLAGDAVVVIDLPSAILANDPGARVKLTVNGQDRTVRRWQSSRDLMADTQRLLLEVDPSAAPDKPLGANVTQLRRRGVT